MIVVISLVTWAVFMLSLLLAGDYHTTDENIEFILAGIFALQLASIVQRWWQK